jgi:hypothetical protein
MLAFRALTAALFCAAATHAAHAQAVYLVDPEYARNGVWDGTNWQCPPNKPAGPFLLQDNLHAYCFSMMTQTFAPNSTVDALQANATMLGNRTNVLESTSTATADLISALTNRINKLEQTVNELKKK